MNKSCKRSMLYRIGPAATGIGHFRSYLTEELPPTKNLRILNKLITTKVRQWLSQLLFGNVHFSDHDEYDAFRYRFLVSLESLGVFAPVLFVAGQASGINPLNEVHLLSVYLFGLSSLAALLWLRGRPERLIQSAWIFEIAALAEFSWSLLYVPTDELRVLWYYINIPCVFILRGQRIGWYIETKCRASAVARGGFSRSVKDAQLFHKFKGFPPMQGLDQHFCLFGLGG